MAWIQCQTATGWSCDFTQPLCRQIPVTVFDCESQTWVTAPGQGAPLRHSSKFWAGAQSASPKFLDRQKERSGTPLLAIHSTPFGRSFQVKKQLFYLMFLSKMNFVPKMNLIRVEKVHFKNTQVLKKILFVVLGHFIRYFTTLLERSNGADMSHSFFWSGATEWSGAAFWERSEKRS